MLAYLAEGALGLPVFTNTPPAVAGPAYFLGPTGGFLLGFVVIAFVVGYAADRGWSRSIPKLFGAMLVGEVIMLASASSGLPGSPPCRTARPASASRTAFTAGVALPARRPAQDRARRAWRAGGVEADSTGEA